MPLLSAFAMIVGKAVFRRDEKDGNFTISSNPNHPAIRIKDSKVASGNRSVLFPLLPAQRE